MIKLQTFFDNPTAIQKPLICLLKQSPSILFSKILVQYYAQLHKKTIDYMPITPAAMPTIMASLQSTFLGETKWYLLGSDEALSKKQQDNWKQFLSSYTGPHTIFFYTNNLPQKPPTSWEIIELPEGANNALFFKLAQVMGVRNVFFKEALFKRTDTVPLDTAVLLVQYSMLLGNGWRSFAESWLPEIVIVEKSLFSLSEALFMQSGKKFYRAWKEILDHYAPQFWIRFWSEQMWRAYWYTHFQQKGKRLEAKKMSYRLPFSFLNRYWRNHSLETFAQAHALLYEIDYHMKNGGTELSFDLFFSLILAD